MKAKRKKTQQKWAKWLRIHCETTTTKTKRRRKKMKEKAEDIVISAMDLNSQSHKFICVTAKYKKKKCFFVVFVCRTQIVHHCIDSVFLFIFHFLFWCYHFSLIFSSFFHHFLCRSSMNLRILFVLLLWQEIIFLISSSLLFLLA